MFSVEMSLFADESLRESKAFLLSAVSQKGRLLQFASQQLQEDKDVVLAAVRQEGRSLQWASQLLQEDKGIALEAVKQDGRALQWLGKGLRDDRELIVEAVKQVGFEALPFADYKHKTDKDMLLLAARLNLNDPDSTTESIYAASKLPREAKTLLLSRSFEKARESAIAVQGEKAPIVTIVELQQVEPISPEDAAAGPIVQYEALLMSGATFERCVPDRQNLDEQVLRAAGEQPGAAGPILDDMAWQLVGELRRRSLATNRVFINFLTNEDGDAVAVSPWEWDRPLRDFLPSPSRGSGAPPQPSEPAHSELSERLFVVTENFLAIEPGQISLEAGQRVILPVGNSMDANDSWAWVQAQPGGEAGWFPCDRLQGARVHLVAASFEAQGADQISLEAGQPVLLLEDCDAKITNGWVWVEKLSEKASGWFPYNRLHPERSGATSS